jgi:hypothetical protein
VTLLLLLFKIEQLSAVEKWQPQNYNGRWEAAMRHKECWEELCQQAAVEPDPKKLMGLVEEINRLLKEKEARLRPQLGGRPAVRAIADFS